MRLWLRRKFRIAEIIHGGRVGIYLVPGVFRVVEVSYNTHGEAFIRLLKEDLYKERYEADHE